MSRVDTVSVSPTCAVPGNRRTAGGRAVTKRLLLVTARLTSAAAAFPLASCRGLVVGTVYRTFTVLPLSTLMGRRSLTVVWPTSTRDTVRRFPSTVNEKALGFGVEPESRSPS